jgi:hypothetical protein
MSTILVVLSLNLFAYGETDANRADRFSSGVIPQGVRFDEPIYLIFILLVMVLGTLVTLYLSQQATRFIWPFRTFRKKLLGNPGNSDKFLLQLADLLPEKQRKIVIQEARDMKEEYDEAIVFGKIVRAKIIVFSYHFGVVWSAFIWVADQLKRVIKFSKK